MDEKLATYLERMNFHDWLDQQLNTGTLIRKNFIAGVARGLGLAIGGTFVLGIISGVFVGIRGWLF